MAEEKKVSRKTVNEFIATGRRKSSTARVRLTAGKGIFVVNKKDMKEYLQTDINFAKAIAPMTLTETTDKYDVKVNVVGGGVAGQAGAIAHGIAQALVEADENLKNEIKKAGFLTRDSRMKERKKYGLKKARKAPQFSKR